MLLYKAIKNNLCCVFNSDFEKSVVGMEHHLHRLPKNHVLFIPKVLFELEKKHDTKNPGEEGMTLLHLAKNHHVTLLEPLKLAEKARMERHSKSELDKESIKAMLAVEESIANIDIQKKEYEMLQVKAK